MARGESSRTHGCSHCKGEEVLVLVLVLELRCSDREYLG